MATKKKTNTGTIIVNRNTDLNKIAKNHNIISDKEFIIKTKGSICINDATFIHCKFSWDCPNGNPDFISMNGVFEYCTFENVNLNLMDITDTSFSETTFDKISAKRCNLSGTTIKGCHIYKSELSHIDFHNTQLIGGRMELSKIKGIEVNNGSTIRDIYFTHITVERGRLSPDTLVYHCDFMHSKLDVAAGRAAIIKCQYAHSLVEGSIEPIYNVFINDLIDCNMARHIPYRCPTQGSFTAWKIAFIDTRTMNGKGNKNTPCVLELNIPSTARRTSGVSPKIRVDEAEVKAIYTIHSSDKTSDYKYLVKSRKKTAYSWHDKRFKYTVGKIIKPDSFDENRYNECSNGIHCFVSPDDAIAYLKLMARV